MSNAPQTITRQELYERVWKTTLRKIAEELGINYVDLVRLCEKLNVPRPVPGHWNRLQLDLPVEVMPLPEAGPDTPLEATLEFKGKRRVITKPVLKEPALKEKSAELGSTTENPQVKPAVAPQSQQVRKDDNGQAPQVTDAVLNQIRQISKIDFWADSLEFNLSEWDLASLLGLPKDHGRSAKSLIAMFKKARMDYDSFTVDVRTGEAREPNSAQISIRVKDGFEWRDVWKEAWKFAQTPNPHCLTDNALKLLRWVRSEKNTGELTEKNKIGRQANLRGSYRDLEDYFKEIQAKVQPRLVVEGEFWGPFKAFFPKEQPKYFHIGPLNTPLKLSLREVKHEELVRFRTWLYAELQRLKFPRDNEMVGLFEVSDRRTVKICFSDWPIGSCWDTKITDFFDALKLMEGISIEYLFEDGPGPWLVICSLSEGWTWSRVKAWLTEQELAIPLRQKYNLSEHSAALLEWIVGLRPEEYLGTFTPVVEDHLDLDMGIETE